MSTTISAGRTGTSQSTPTISSTGGSASSTGATTQAAPVKYTTLTAYWAWWTITGVIGLLALVYVFTLIRHEHRRRAAVTVRKLELNGPAAVERSTTQSSGLKRFACAIETIWQDVAYLRVFPLWMYSYSTSAEVFFTAAYTGIVLALAFYGTAVNGADWTNPVGIMAFNQVPLIIGLAGKNNTISYLTGISYQKLNYLHRASARHMFFMGWLHGIGWMFVRGLSGKHTLTTLEPMTGIPAIICFTVVALTSLRIVRKILYELFLLVHIVFILAFLVLMYFHYDKGSYWIYAGLVIWASDRIVSFGRLVIVNKLWLFPTSRRGECGECTAELLSENVIRLTMNRPLLEWSSGQHAFISMPSVGGGPHEQHPFSFASIRTKEEKSAVFLLRVHRGITRKLLNHLQSGTETIKAYIDGPYGISRSMIHNDVVLLIAGGTGITHVLSQFLEVVAAARAGTAATRRLHLVWHVRHADSVSWIAPLLNIALARPVPGLEIAIDVHVTRSTVGRDPDCEALPSTASVSPETSTAERVISLDRALNAIGSASESGGSAESSKLSSTDLDNIERGKEKETGSLGSPASASASTTKMDEKSETRGAAPTHDTLIAQVQDLVTHKIGRAYLLDVIKRDVLAAAGPMALSVCGPDKLALDARRAVSAVTTPAAVLRGQQSIEVFLETFGW